MLKHYAEIGVPRAMYNVWKFFCAHFICRHYRHNSHQYFNLFRAIRKAIHDDKVDELEQALLRYYPVANQHVAVDSVTNELSSPAINCVQSACLTRDELIN